MLAKLVTQGRPEWPLLRRIVQNMDSYQKSNHGLPITAQMCSDILLGKANKLPIKLRFYLTLYLDEIKIKEQK